jgi:hypothetical protein
MIHRAAETTVGYSESGGFPQGMLFHMREVPGSIPGSPTSLFNILARRTVGASLVQMNREGEPLPAFPHHRNE